MSVRRTAAVAAAATAALALGATAAAAYELDLSSGHGFVGKGEVQTAFALNNKALQDAAQRVDFHYSASSVTTWTCTKVVQLGNGGENEIVQLRSTSTSTQGVLGSVARERNQVNGFVLQGWSGPATTLTSGDPVGSCPAAPSGFVFDDNAETSTVGGGLYAVLDGVAVPLG